MTDEFDDEKEGEKEEVSMILLLCVGLIIES